MIRGRVAIGWIVSFDELTLLKPIGFLRLQ